VWAQVTTTGTPPGRSGQAMAYDSARQRVVMFGGEGSSGVLRDTWEYNGATSTWTSRVTTTGPSARLNALLVYDPVRAVTVLFGGNNFTTTTTNNETWEWNGTTWTQRAPTASPSIRHSASGAWDPVRQRVVLFGGVLASGNSNEVWEFDGTTWSLRAGVGTPPSARFGAAVAYDVARSRLVVSGGNTGGMSQFDTWELGTTWQEVTTAPLSPARYFAAAAFHTATARTVSACGNGTSGILASASSFDGTTWTALASAPTSRGWVVMTSDSTRGKLVLFGGYNNVTGLFFNDTWEY
jgi:hypothetical protein